MMRSLDNLYKVLNSNFTATHVPKKKRLNYFRLY